MYKPLVLFNLLTDLYPGTPICCNTTYASILLHDTTQSLVPEQTILESYPSYVRKYNLTLLRRIRNKILAPTDKYALSDYPFPDDATKQAWQAYRQALRDITIVYPTPEVDDYDNVIGITWPISPNGDTGPLPPKMPMTMPPTMPPTMPTGF